MDPSSRIIIIGAGAFGLSTAYELNHRGFRNILVLDRHTPPVPDGSSVDISRVIRFDYGDLLYTKIAKEAYDLWSSSPLYQKSFFKHPFILATAQGSGRQYIDRCLSNLQSLSLPYKEISCAKDAKTRFPTLTGPLAGPHHYGYSNTNAGWADAAVAIADLRDRCVEVGVSFLCGAHGTVTALQDDPATGSIVLAKTVSGTDVSGDLFIAAPGAWTAQLVPMHQTILATGQVLGFLKLTAREQIDFQDLPIYIDLDSGWFCFPPHGNSGHLKIAVHGLGYTRSTNLDQDPVSALSGPGLEPSSARKNFAPEDGVERLRKGLRNVLPELADREFDRTSICWYTDTPTGDFIIDYHPEHSNLFLATGGSGHAFKFLPVLGRYIVAGIERSLPDEIHKKWRFRNEYRGENLFKGDGSRGGPARREFTEQEKSKL